MNFLNRIKVSHRFLLAGSMSVVLAALPTYYFLRGELSDLGAVRAEQTGVAPVRVLFELNRLLQQHRGLSNRLLKGNAEAASELQAVQKSIEQKQAEVNTYLDSQPKSPVMAQWKPQLERWNALRGQVDAKTIAAADSFAEHVVLVHQLNQTLNLLLDDSGLALDPASDTYHLIMASTELFSLAELQAQMRGLGAGLLAAKSATPEEVLQIRILLAQSQVQQQRSSELFDKASRSSGVIAQRLQALLEGSNQAAAQAFKLTTDQLLRDQAYGYEPKAYFQTMTEALDRQFELADQGFKLVEELLQQRGDEQQRALLLVIVTMLLTMAAGTALSLLGARSVIRQLGGEPGEVVDWVGTIAQGDLSTSFPQRDAAQGSIVQAMNAMQVSLQRMVLQVRSDAEQVVDASGQIAAGNSDLSGRTERQASAIEEISSSMEELLATVRQNADNARQANGLASSASDVALRSGDQMTAVVETMKGITDSAHKIGDIIGVIDGIAFQTNILALNAAVEAARAGEQGRGFAVVATEVRNLAQRSAVAAKEIKSLIADSIEKVEQGSVQVSQTGETMHHMVTSVKRVTDIMGEVSASSVEQTAGIEQVNSAIMQMDQVTQQNAALVEQAAAASDSLRTQAQHLVEVVGSFKVAQGFAPAPLAPPISSRKIQPAPAPMRKPATSVSTSARKLPKPGAAPATSPVADSPSPGPAASELKRPALDRPKASPPPSDNDWEEF